LIRECDKKTPEEICKELQKSASRIKKGDDFEYQKMKSSLRYVPTFLVGPILKLMGFFLYGLNLWSPLLNAPRDSFGSMMITSVGMLGIDNGFAPLVPYSRCPGLMAVGEIRKKAVIVDNEVCIRPILNIGVTMDHRHIDGKGASYMLRAFRNYLENPA
jgi:pyruvate dehydrogenase E2 component (dihydrolipoamide acetyltransferase)